MPKDVEFIAEFRSSAEAALAKSRLAEEGIEAYVDGTLMADWLWHLETALGGVQMFVDSNEAERARDILRHCRSSEEDADEASVKQPLPKQEWTCVNCGTQVDPAFDVCWNCGTSADGQEDDDFEIQRIATIRPAEDEAPPPWLAMLASVNPVTFLTFVFSRLSVSGSVGTVYEDSGRMTDAGQESDPLREADQPPTAASEDEAAAKTPDEEISGRESEVEKLTLMAWRASIIGIVVLPLFLHLYSLWLIFRHRLLTNGENRRVRRAWAAFFIDIAVITLTWLIFVL